MNHRRQFRPIALAALLAAAGCADDEPQAYGNFEADETTVSAEVAGRLLAFSVREGDLLTVGQSVGLIDTTQTALALREAQSRLAAARSGTGQANAEVGALATELDTAERDLGRVQRLHESGAATDRQLDQATNRVEVLRSRIRAGHSGSEGRSEEARALEARIAQLEDQLSRSRLESPVAGTVLSTFAEVGEFVQPGRSLYEVARLDTLTFRAYVDGRQLADITIGQAATVRVDGSDGGLRGVEGRVSRIASEAEFTPTPIQTRDERAELVYAVEVRVPNPDGRLKIGMPGDVDFGAGAARAD